jgi:Pyruvate/2-oxoacid:ferredoxin oxidoreductase delta subunit
MANYVYGMSTGYLNLQKHLTSKHAADYDKAILENCWNYCPSTNVKSSKSDSGAQNCSLLLFTQASFLEYIICFIVADDQVSNMFIFH